MRAPLRSFLAAAFVTAIPAARSAPGDVDSLDANIVKAASSIAGGVYAVAVQADGKIILAGSFDSVMDSPRSNLARLNADGTLDTTFNPRVDGLVVCVAVQDDGKVLIGGQFMGIQPSGSEGLVARQNVARLNADGTLDPGFDVAADNFVVCLAVQPDGKVLLGGHFMWFHGSGGANPVASRYVVRVDAAGTVDPTFDAGVDQAVYCMCMQPDGKVIIGGGFQTARPSGAAPVTRRGVARFNSDGTLDTGFDPNPDNYVYCLAVQADGNVLLGGGFLSLQPNGASAPTTRNRIARVNADGSLDTGFNPNANNNVLSMAVQADGKVLLAGHFTNLQPNGAPSATRLNIARVNATGTLDTGFNPMANESTGSLALQADGKVLLGGIFTNLRPNDASSPTNRRFFARLQNDAATEVLTFSNASDMLWTRGGGAPELNRVTFEVNTTGGVSWNPLGAGTRIGTTANWRINNLTLSGSGQIRARGFTSGDGTGNGGGVAQIAGFSLVPDADHDGLLDSWELTWWPSIDGHAALDDNDHDGYNELLELALGLNPNIPEAGGQPPVRGEDGYLTLALTKNAGVNYEVQSAGTLLHGLPNSFSATTTTVLADNATTLKVRDNFPIGTPPARYLRVKVTASP